MALVGGASTDRNWIEEQVAPYRCFFTGLLAAYDETPLTSADEGYRLIWDPSFHAPVVVRIEKHGDRYRATITRDPSDGVASDPLESRTIDISAKKFRSVQRKVEKAGCWSSDHGCSGAQADPRFRDYASVVVDGTAWVLEGVRGAEHWAVYVHAPVPGAFRDAGAAIARAAGLDVNRAE